MYQLKRRGPVGFEDLLREMEAIEHQLLSENSAVAMDLMVLEARIRERFQAMDGQTQVPHITKKAFVDDDLNLEELQALIPKELPYFPTMGQVSVRRERKKTWETVGMAALLALGTALGVFGLASLLQFILTWVA